MWDTKQKATNERISPGWVAHWLERRPAHGKAAGLIHSQGAHLGCGWTRQVGHMQEATGRRFSLTDFFFSLSLPSSSAINKQILR